MSDDLSTLESRAYRDTYSDGIIDLFVGLSLVWIGIAWIWIESFAALAGVFPAVLVTSVLSTRKRIVEARHGYVRWSAPRRQWERRNLLALVGAGLVIFGAGVVVFLIVDNRGGGSLGAAVAALPAWLLAFIAVATGWLIGAWRMLAYAAALIVGGVIVVAAEAMPGWPMLIGGSVITTIGAVMVARFLRRHPGVEAP